MGLSEARRSRRPQRRTVPGLAVREAAAELVRAVVDRREPLAVDRGPLDALEGSDRAFARAIATTALRRHGQIRDALAGLLARPLPPRAGGLPAILEVAAAQILFMDVPDHAAVSVAVEAAAADAKAQHFKALANGVLRTLVRERDTILARQDAARLNTPGWLFDRWVAAYAEPEARRVAEAHLAEAPLDLTVKGDAPGWAERLGGVALPNGTVRLPGGGRIEALPGFEEGAWWVQDFAASLPATLLGDVAGKTVLDLCAAPGGKTAQLALAGARVTAVDAASDRVERLRGNLSRLRLEAECVVADALDYDPGRTFDAILLDAPCTSTGTIRRHPDIPFLKRASDIPAMAALQTKLLERAAHLVRPGGVVVYATCSLEPEEGERLAQEAIGSLPLAFSPIRADDSGLPAGLVRSDGVLRTLPSSEPDGIAGGMDGFFAARFVRV